MHYFYPNAWKLLEFPALGDDLRSCSLKMSTKLFELISSISAQNDSNFSNFSENSCACLANFAISLLLFDDFPNYLGFFFLNPANNRCIRYL